MFRSEAILKASLRHQPTKGTNCSLNSHITVSHLTFGAGIIFLILAHLYIKCE
jgi:hypothetical protein